MSQHPTLRTQSSVPASNLSGRDELTRYKESDTTAHIKAFPGEKYKSFPLGFPTAKHFRGHVSHSSPLVHILEMAMAILLLLLLFCLWFSADSFLCSSVLFSSPFILIVWSLSISSYNFLGFRFSLPGDLDTKCHSSHNSWNIDCANDSSGSMKIWLTLTSHALTNQAPVSSFLHPFGLRHC